MECHSSRYLCRFIPHIHCNHSRGSNWQGGKYQVGQKCGQLAWAICLFQLLLKQRGRGTTPLAVELIQDLGRRISAVSRPNTNRFLASAAERGFTTWKCCILPQHFHHRINVADLPGSYYFSCYRAMLCGARYVVCLSVRLSICLSVCPWRSGTVKYFENNFTAK